MTKDTKKETLIQQLKQVGCFEVKGGDAKYSTFNHAGLSDNIYVGRHGALRYGKAISKSRSVQR